MDWYFWVIIIMGTMLFFLMIAFFLARHVIKLRIKAFLGRRGDNLLAVEMAKNRRLHMTICKNEDNKIQYNNKTYGIVDKDVFLSPEFGIPAVVVNEIASRSLNYDGEESALSPRVIDGLILRVKATAAGEIYKLLKWAYIAFGCVALAIILQIFVIWRLYAAIQAKGIAVNF